MKMKIVKNHKPLLVDRDPILVNDIIHGQKHCSQPAKFNRSDKKKFIPVEGLVPDLTGFGARGKGGGDIGGRIGGRKQVKTKKVLAPDDDTGAEGDGKGKSRATKKRLKLKAKQQSSCTALNGSSSKHADLKLLPLPATSIKRCGSLTLVGKRKRVIDDMGEEVEGSSSSSSHKANGSMQDLDPSSFKSIVDIVSLEDFKNVGDASIKARLLLGFIIQPLSIEDFYSSYWDKECHTSAKSSSGSSVKNRKKFSKLFSSQKFLAVVEEQLMSLGTDLSLLPCSSSKGTQAKQVRTEGQVTAAEVKSLFATNGFGLQLLQPQKFDDLIWKLLSILETEFGTAVSCNATLLPAYFECAQATYQLSDMYVLQLEGRSVYEVFKPAIGKYPVDSVVAVDILDEKLVLEAKLAPGDYLYVPAGWIFTYSSASADQSLFLRLDVGEGNTMCSFLDMLLPHAMKEVFTTSAEMRRAMPRHVQSYMGVAYSDNDTSMKRKKFMAVVRTNLLKIVDNAIDALDAAVDQHTKEFMIARLPIALDRGEEARCAVGAPNAPIFPYTKLRVVRPGAARALIEDGKVAVYHCMDNGRERFTVPSSSLEFDLDDGPAIEELLSSYPKGVTVEEIPHPSEELDDKMAVAQALYKEGLLVIEDEASRPLGREESDSDDPF